MTSTSSPRRRCKYDVFLSFRGEDTRKTFICHLYRALTAYGITTFSDDESLERWANPSLLTAIEDSRMALVVLSKNFASSSWCLNELLKILQCMGERGQRVYPIFYQVEPSDVLKQSGSFQLRTVGVREHEEVYGNNDKLTEWTDALTKVANLSGWASNYYRDDGKLIEEIVQVALTVLRDTYTSSSVDMGLIGMDSRIDDLLSNYICPQLGGVRFIGIHGMRGIGKTTLARAIYEELSHRFDRRCFLFNVREKSEHRGLVSLQENLVSSIMRAKVGNLEDEYTGAAMIQRRLCRIKVLVVIDDVDLLTQLEKLAGSRNWFGPGSRIIITTTDIQLLKAHDVDATYKATGLTRDEAIQLLSLKAFNKCSPPEDYLDLCHRISWYAQGLPLALVVLGSFLLGRRADEWASAIERLNNKPNRVVTDVLRISFDGLDEMEKGVFLDIACFFKGESIDRVTRILHLSVNNVPDISIQILVDKALVTLVGSKLWMHDLLQQLGKEIVFQESTKKPGKRSRLWLPQEIIHVLEMNKGSSAVRAIALDSPKTEEIHCHSEAFSVMHRLQFLQIRNVHMKEGPSYLPGGLIVLEWSGYPIESLPQNFDPRRLYELNLCYSSIEQLWSGIKNLPYLTVINLSYSLKLIRTPDFTFAPGLERLILEGCKRLVVIHPSIAHLERLTCLNLKGCRSLASLPSELETKCLRILVLSGCSKVKKIPDFVESMEGLLELYLDETAIEQIPISIQFLTGLILLNLRDCKSLKRLPTEIGNLKSLKRLNICGCSKLETLPDSLGKIDCLEELDASGGSSISNIPSSISCLENLEVLSFGGCKEMSGNMTRYPLSFLFPISGSGGLRSLMELNLSDCNLQEGSIPEDFGCLFPLVSLDLSKNNFDSLPKSIRQLSKLRSLNLETCKSLQKLPDLSSSLNFSFGVAGGFSRERLSSCFNLINCSKLVVNQRCNNIALKMLWRFLQGIPSAENKFETIIPGSEISELFSGQSVGPVISMDLPRQWHKNKWMGYAFCACFVIRRYLPVPANRLGKWKFGTHSTANGLRCEVKPENLGVAGWCPSFACSQELGQIESEHLWLSFVSGDYFGTAWQETCYNIEFTFKTLGTGMEVKKCGVRLIYEQDLDLN